MLLACWQVGILVQNCIVSQGIVARSSTRKWSSEPGGRPLRNLLMFPKESVTGCQVITMWHVWLSQMRVRTGCLVIQIRNSGYTTELCVISVERWLWQFILPSFYFSIVLLDWNKRFLPLFPAPGLQIHPLQTVHLVKILSWLIPSNLRNHPVS